MPVILSHGIRCRESFRAPDGDVNARGVMHQGRALGRWEAGGGDEAVINGQGAGPVQRPRLVAGARPPLAGTRDAEQDPPGRPEVIPPCPPPRRVAIAPPAPDRP